MKNIINKKDDAIRNYYIDICVRKDLTNKQVAEFLNLSVRQVIRLKNEYKANGGLSIHGNSGITPKNKIDDYIISEILALKNSELYKTANIAHFREAVADRGFILSYEALRKILLDNGIESPRKHKIKKIHKTRSRKAHFGEMLQGDASKHRWFLNNDNQYNLHGFIDDATGRITALYMTKNECLQGYYNILEQTIEKHGIPNSLYLDGLSTFFGTKERILSIEEQLEGKNPKLTQFGEVANSLGVELIHARSSQAKGRIERLWGTLQGRLPIEFAKRNITTVEDVNIFLAEYVDIFANKFGVNPTSSKSLFLPLSPEIDLEKLLTYKAIRTINKGSTFSLYGTIFRVENLHKSLGEKVTILISEKIGIKAAINSELYDVRPISKVNNPIKQESSSIDSIINNFVYEFCLKDEREPK
jgi:transposase